MKSLNDVLMDEIYKMDLKKKVQIKTRYGRNDMEEEYAMDTESYFKEKNNYNRGLPNLVKKL